MGEDNSNKIVAIVLFLVFTLACSRVVRHVMVENHPHIGSHQNFCGKLVRFLSIYRYIGIVSDHSFRFFTALDAGRECTPQLTTAQAHAWPAKSMNINMNTLEVQACV